MTFWPGRLNVGSASGRGRIKHQIEITSLTSPRVLIVPVPVSWVGNAKSPPSGQRPAAGAEIDRPRGPGSEGEEMGDIGFSGGRDRTAGR